VLHRVLSMEPVIKVQSYRGFRRATSDWGEGCR
jgi:hypothetical protein